LENAVTTTENGFLQGLLLHSYIQQFAQPPKHIVLDVDTTCDPVHGYQQLSFFNGFYHKECYIPLFVFDQAGYPLLARLRPGNFAPAEQAAADIRHIVEGLRKAWPTTRIELIADAAFGNRDFYRLCRVRLLEDIKYQSRTWDIERRVICRCDYTEEGPELRFIVTNSSTERPKWVYETKYCGRGQCENWIKELKYIKCDRLSCQEFEANQFRLLLHTFAYVLIRHLRESLSKRQPMMSVGTLRLRLIKIGVLVRESARRVLLQWSSTCPWQSEFLALHAAMQC
jgi:hypothetical protein